ncbi:MAG: LysR family transcriptional regulator [Eubacteriales bacterium]|nr:LysR family transcriptional regulator [Eubacteriales bacterium]
MELKQLHYFKTVVDEGTISAAARRLNMSQPPLSSQMHLLEEELGCVLFERGPRKIQLTEAGRLFYERAGNMLELAQITAREMQDYRQGKAGTLRIGVVSSVGTLLLKKWIGPFHEKFPQIRYEIYEGNTYQILEQIRANLIELALVRTPFSGEGLEAVRLTREPMMAAGDARFFPEGCADTVSIRDLAGQPLIVYRRWEEILTKQFEKAKVSPYYFCKNDDARTSLEWARAGMGIAIFPESAGQEMMAGEDAQMRICRILAPGLESEICAVYNVQGYFSTAARTLMEEMRGRQDS